MGARAKLIAHIEALATPDALTPTRAPGLSVYVWNTSRSVMHLVYRPALCVVLRGEKTARIGDRSFLYNEARFFFTAVPLPAELTVERSNESSILGLVLELDLEVVARVALEIEDTGATRDPHSDPTPDVMFSGQLNASLLDALERLVRAASDPVRHRVLHPGLLREVVFELLTSSEGQALRRTVRAAGQLRPLVDTMRFMEEHCTQPMSIPELATRCGMSESGFYAHFRQATGTTPLRYLKSLRLIRARVMLATGADSVTAIAFDVGYRSSAQFSRDFRRAFGCPPSALRDPIDRVHA